MGDYRFVTLFSVEVDPDRLFDGLLRPEAWWPSAPHARDVQRLSDGGTDGVGARYRVQIDAVTAPYAMDMDVEVTAVRAPERLEVRVRGDLEGHGTWELDARGSVTDVRWLWEVATTKTWMNVLGPIARPAFVHNHDLVMREGIEALVASVGGRLVDYQRAVGSSGPRWRTAGAVLALALAVTGAGAVAVLRRRR